MSYIDKIVTKEFRESGEKYVTSLYELDLGFGNHLVRFFQGFQVPPTPGKRDNNVRAFFNRKPKDQLFYGKYDNPADFLDELKARNRGRQSEQGKGKAPINTNALPVVYYGREFGVSASDGGEYPPVRNYAEVVLEKEGKDKRFKLDKMFMDVEYTIRVLAWEESSLSHIINAINHQLVFTNKQFAFQSTMLDGIETLHGEIKAPREIVWSDESISATDGRLLVASLTIPCTVETIIARGQEIREVELFIPEGLVIE